MFDSQAPDIEIIADGRNHIDLCLAPHQPPDTVAKFSHIYASDVEEGEKKQNHKEDQTHDEAPVNPDPQPQTQKHKRNLINAVPQRARPRTDRRTDRVEQPVRERDDERVAIGKVVFDEVCGDHLPDAVGVNEADVKDEGDEVVVEDDGLEVEVQGDEDPG